MGLRPELCAPMDPHRYAGGFAAAVDLARRREDSLHAPFCRRRALMLLLNPGPVSLTDRVRRSLLQPDLCHRESEFFDLQDEARKRLLAVYALEAAEWAAVLITGSGTAAVESMVAALVPKSGRVLVVENGVYGERIGQICAQYQIAHERAAGSWMQAADQSSISAQLDAAAGNSRFTHLAVVH